MNTELDPIITRKLDDFRLRRRNLILLRGLCSGVLSFLGTFVLIALIDYLTEGRMSGDLRSGLSFIGYFLVIALLWKTCVGPLLQLPSSKKLARLLEQSSPDLREDLLSAVELGISNQSSTDSEIFRKLVQRQASTKASKIDIKNVLPLGTLKYWLRGTAGLIALTIALMQIPDFGSDFKLLMQRAIMPGSNLPPVSYYDVRILSPDENVTRTPSNEPLRFVTLIKPKKADKTFKEITLETKTKKENKDVTLSKRSPEKFFVDYNVGNEAFEYRILVDQAPQTEWRKMDVGARPFIKSFKKTFEFPEYSELKSIETIDDHGDLEAWEGTTVKLSLIANRPLKSGKLEFQWVEKPGELRQLEPDTEKNILPTSIRMTHPGSYRVKNLIDEQLGWEGKPSSNFQITVKPDLAPLVQWVEPTERKLLVAPSDLLSFSALAQDDLGLARVEYLIKKNQGKWEAFTIPNMLDTRGKNSVAINFNLDLLLHKFKPGTQALLKLRARDLKGTNSETETIELSVISRDFELSSLNLLEKKAMVLEHFDVMREESQQMQKNFQRSLKDFQQNKKDLSVFLEKGNQAESEFITTAQDAYENTIRSLVSMPRGADSFQLSILAQAEGQILHTLGTTWRKLIENIEKSTETNQIRTRTSELTRKVLSRRISMLGNFRNVSQDLLNQHAETVAVSYLKSLLKRQKELVKNAEERKAIPFIVRRQEVALSQWEPVSKSLSYSRDWQRSSALKKIKSEQLKLQQSLGEFDGDRKTLQKQILDWEKIIQNILKEAGQKLASKSRESFRLKSEELYWNLNRNHMFWDELNKKWKKIDQAKPDKMEQVVSEVLSETDIVVAETMMLSEVEQSRKDQNALFVKDAGQTGRALIKIQQDIRNNENFDELAEKSSKIGTSFDLLLLQHHLIGSANQIIFFMRKENSKPTSWQGAECARQWGRAEAIWKPILDSMHRMRLSKEVIEIMKKLPNQQYRKNIVREMQHRLKFDRKEITIMIEDANLVFQDLQKIISLLKDDVREARSFINQNAPTLAELARGLALETEKQKEKTQEIKDDANQTLADKKEDLNKLNQEQQQISDSVENFAQALRQEANIQNLLDEQGRELARDSDDAAALVEETESEIVEKLSNTLQSQNQEEIENSTNQAIEKQEELIEELNLIADHFEKLDKEESVAETRAELRNLEESLEMSEEIEEQYAQAERLADLAQLAPEELLEELVEELDQNQVMQHELSDLAQETVEEAKEELEQALTEEENLIDELEKEDQEIQKQKKELAKKLEELAKETQKLAEQKIEPVQEQAEKAQATTAVEIAEEVMEALDETGEKVQDLAKEKPDTQELKNAASELAESLKNASDELGDLSEDLAEQADITPEQAEKKATQTEEIAKNALAQAESLQKDADLKNEEAQNAQQQSLLEKLEEDKIKEKLSAVEQELAQAEKKSNEQPDDPNTKEKFDEAKEEFAELTEDLKEAKQESSEAQKIAEELQEKAKLAQADVDIANEKAEEALTQAEEAKQIAEAIAEQGEQEANAQASKKGSELADEAAQQALDLQQQAEALAEALDQLTESAEGNQELLADAKEAQQQIAEELFDTSQDLARAARHEERLENQEASDVLESLAESTEDAALNQIQETAQSLENQALANELQDLAASASDLAEELNQSKPEGDEQVAEDLADSASEIEGALEDQPSFTELQKQAEEFSEQANQAEQELNQLAEDLAVEAESAQEAAKSTAEAAMEAKAEMLEASNDAKQAKQLAENLEKNADLVAQAAQEGSASSQQADEVASEAQSAKEEAEQLASLAEAAGENLENAQELANSAQQAAKLAEEESVQASQQAEMASNLANAAEQLLEDFPEPFSPDLIEENLPGAAMALNEASDTLESQVEALENLQSGEPINPESISSNNPSEQGSSEFANLPAEDTDSTDFPFSSSTPFTNAEVSEVLAQTLDSLDQAIFENENPFTESQGEVAEATSSSEMAQGEQTGSENTPGEFSGEPNELPGEPIPGTGPGTGGSGQQSAMATPIEAMAFALQSLQLATEAHAQAMAQQRSKIIMSDTQGNQMNSSDGEYQVAPVAEVGDLPDFDQTEEDDWGKLPPRLAKDLLEAKRERVSENYRNQVQAYFQAMANKARTTKK